MSASLIFITAYWWFCVAVIVGINVAACGADGWDLPIQVIFGFANPYPLSVGQAVLAMSALGYVVALGMAAFTLLLSAKMRSTMPVAVIPMAVTFLGLFALFINNIRPLIIIILAGNMGYELSDESQGVFLNCISPYC